jgi:hypothetical protein
MTKMTNSHIQYWNKRRIEKDPSLRKIMIDKVKSPITNIKVERLPKEVKKSGAI